MEFENDRQKEIYEKVATWLSSLFGEDNVKPDDEYPKFYLTAGSALVQIFVRPWLNDDCLVSVWSPVVIGPEINPDLMKFLLNANATFYFGAFSLDKDGDVIFDYSVYGSTISKEELRFAVRAVASTADKYDDEIVSRWGGQRMADR